MDKWNQFFEPFHITFLLQQTHAHCLIIFFFFGISSHECIFDIKIDVQADRIHCVGVSNIFNIIVNICNKIRAHNISPKLISIFSKGFKEKLKKISFFLWSRASTYTSSNKQLSTRIQIYTYSKYVQIFVEFVLLLSFRGIKSISFHLISS